MKLRHFCCEALHHGGLAPAVLVDGEHDESQVTAGIEASDDEHWLDVGDVGEHDLGHNIDHLQHEDLVQTPVKPSLASGNRTQINHTESQAAGRGMPFLDLCDKVAVENIYISFGNRVMGLTVQLILFSLSLSI